MGFLVAAVAFMAVSVCLVHYITRRFGLFVDPRALALCAVMALAVNFAAILLSAYLTLNHFMMLIGMVLVSAALVTGLNELLLRRAACFSDAAEPSGAQTAYPVSTSASDTSGALSVGIPAARAETASDPAPPKRPALEPPPATPEASASLSAASPIYPAQQTPSARPAPAATKPQPIQPTPTSVPTVPPAAAKPTKTHTAPPRRQKSYPAAHAARRRMRPNSAAQDAPALPAALVTLDDFLDYAHTEKNAGRPETATAAYWKAIRRFPGDSYAPFLAIELGGLYKETGAYTNAVKIYRHALTLPIVSRQSGMTEEFKKNIAYLGIVAQTVARHGAPNIPFSKIPPDWLAEIESAFAEQTAQ